MTSDEVLAVLVDVWRQRIRIDPNPHYEIPLTRETNIEVAANHLGVPRLADDWVDIAHLLMSLFRVDIDKEAWRDAIHPKKQKTLGPVCDLIAEHALAPMIRRDFDGATLDWPTSAFRTMLLVLDDAGVDVGSVKPETRLRPFLERYELVFAYCVSRLAPGKMPVVTRRRWPFRVSMTCLGIAMMLLLFSPILPFSVPPGFYLWPVVLAGVLSWLTSGKKWMRPGFDGIDTFADLATAMVSPPPEQGSPACDESGGVRSWDKDQHPAWDGVLYEMVRRG